jgi:hypothetical protein
MNTTEKVLNLFWERVYTKTRLAKDLGVSRPTLDSRTSGRSKWKKLEVDHINRVFNEWLMKEEGGSSYVRFSDLSGPNYGLAGQLPLHFYIGSLL